MGQKRKFAAGSWQARQAANKAEQSVFAEARQNMSADLEKFLPLRLREGKGKWKFALALAFFELVVLGVIGKLIYHWLTG